MEIGIVGLPKSGKTTIFNAVTRGAAQVAAYGGLQTKPNIGVAKVPDSRLDVLEAMFKPRRKTYAEVTYFDIPAAPEGRQTRGISGEFLNQLQRADALLVVVRAFEDASVPHVNDSVNPIRDLEAMLYELAFADMEILERRMARLTDSFKGAKAPEREALNREKALLERLKAELESGVPLRSQKLSDDDARKLGGFRFLTAKPLIAVANVGEGQLAEASALEQRLASAATWPGIRAATLCGKLEMELAQMEPEEEQAFRQSLGVGESGLNRMIRLSYDVLDLITFFTVGDTEARAWPITRGTTALKAAGKIHSDLERGFIRAEVVAFDDLHRCGSMAEARRQGLLRQEGKTYVVKDGDVILILFNV
jgi:GTP-binding protein YchF